MPIHLNSVQLTGRAGHDVECHALTDGTPFARLRIYHDCTTTEGATQSVPFVVTAWGPLAQSFYERVHKGDHLLVRGRLRLRSWKQQGGQFSRPEIHLEQFFSLR